MQPLEVRYEKAQLIPEEELPPPNFAKSLAAKFGELAANKDATPLEKGQTQTFKRIAVLNN